MSDNRFRDAVGKIDDRLLARCEAYEQQLSHKKKRVALGWVAAAACLAAILGVLLHAWVKDPPHEMNTPTHITTGTLPGNGTVPTSKPHQDVTVPPTMPAWEDALFSAEDIAALFPGQGGLSPDSAAEYQTVCVPNAAYLGLHPLPTPGSLPVYQHRKTEYIFDEASLSEFANSIFPALAEALGGTVPDYTVNTYTSRVDMDTAIGDHGISVIQYGYLNYLCISRFPWRSGTETTTTLFGQPVQADQSQSDEAIIAGLAEARRILQDIFGVDFPDAKVVRMYDTESDYGALVLQVYFYDESAHPLNACSESPISDHIQLWFYNNPIFMEDQCSETVLQYVDIIYRDWREDMACMYPQTETTELLSLAEAELLLAKGYTFGVHRCPICNISQDAVDFTDYDHVSFTYQWPRDQFSKDRSTSIPVYVFYKRIGTAENGNEIYAQTFVPAVAVSGLEEYFHSQEKYHTVIS